MLSSLNRNISVRDLTVKIMVKIRMQKKNVTIETMRKVLMFVQQLVDPQYMTQNNDFTRRVREAQDPRM